ncbi:MAG: ParB/RepB/Spo0J family partition protein [Pseudomonadota bacterium]
MATNDRKRGLGRGLSALMSDVAIDPAVHEGSAPPQTTLPIEYISANPDQPRKTFDADDMQDLSNSIREKGIIQPLIVRQLAKNSYQLVAGERRWRAAQMVNLHAVPVVIRAFTDLEVMEIAIIENIQRADLNPVEEAVGYRQLMDKFGHTQERLAEALGKSRSHIANVLRLLNLPDSVLQLLQDGKLTSGHARALITADDPVSLARQIVAQGLSVRATEALVKKQADGQMKTKPTGATGISGASKDADTLALEGDLSAALKMRVTIDHQAAGEGGTLTVRYASLDQLDELCGRLSGH